MSEDRTVTERKRSRSSHAEPSEHTIGTLAEAGPAAKKVLTKLQPLKHRATPRLQADTGCASAAPQRSKRPL